MKHFIPEYLWGTGKSDQTLLAGRSVEFKIKKLQLIVKNLHSPKQVSWTKWNRTWILYTVILFVLCALKFIKIMQLGFHIFSKGKVNFSLRAHCNIQKKKPKRFLSKVIKLHLCYHPKGICYTGFMPSWFSIGIHTILQVQYQEKLVTTEDY